MEAITIRFHAVYEKLGQALAALEFDELGISDEVREQVYVYIIFSFFF